MPEPTENEINQKSADLGTVVYQGGGVKALGDGRIGGYLVRFSDASAPDLTGEFFTSQTYFGDHDKADVYYNHGLDRKVGKRRLGRASLTTDEVGVWAETQLAMRDEYERMVYDMAQKGKLGWSSGTATHLIESEPAGRAVWLKSWPLGLDASLTPTPAEPRNAAIPLKSLMLDDDEATEPEPEPQGGEPAEDGGAVDLDVIRARARAFVLLESEGG